ncbi:uncharacterized protein PFL1_03554 [Pseudozyma flocculosa PF-1]|uniref:Related to triacylglycerol lipase n=2 Tax=Pseudozyma flocculosa TaxID=84751 RepID=A0A5C3F662_9BASI|nr:uncharacterized protein PFL1_03554 [Pseudozyma flocculosa PF-1]EPQ28751.1 hypothetical protein PFL1_03554 [Pseudozyma flocculosa PF-1]SPO39476.1 related to triacylglycerol lipase [Pseudozyma flocculosa]
MSSVERHHPWTWATIKLRIFAFLFRCLVFPKRIHNYRSRRAGPGVEFETLYVPSRDDGRTITVDLYKPEGSGAKKLPVHINWHGSGFLLPSHGEDVDFVKQGVLKTGAAFADANYRKAPAHPFPAQSNDAEDVVAYFLSKPEVYDVSKVTVGGFSAGGSLALGVATRFGPSRIRAAACIYPPCDFTVPIGTSPVACPKPRSGFPLPPWMSRLFNACYILPGTDRADPRLSPIKAAASDFPDTVFIACGNGDTLYDGGKRTIEKLQRDGHKRAEFMHIENEGHGFDKMARHPESKRNKQQMYDRLYQVIQESW